MSGPKEVQIDISHLKGKSVMLATPMYGGLGNTMYMTSCMQLQGRMQALGMRLEHCFMMNESLIDRARNGLVDEFLTKSNADYLLFVDADIEFRPEDVLAMLSFDKDVICGPYPKKHINWSVIVEAIQKGETKPEVLERLVGQYVFSTLNNGEPMGMVMRVEEAGTGLMLIKRDVFKRLKEAYPNNEYISDGVRDLGKDKIMHAYFRTDIVEKRYLSEDYYFCRKWRDIGGEVWLFPWAQTTHYGTYGFKGSVGHLVELMQKGEKVGS